MRSISVYLFSLMSIFFLSSCASQTRGKQAENKQDNAPATVSDTLSKYSKATFAVGCFWCMEGIYESIKGVKEVISGYSGGTKPNPTYEEVSSGKTNYAESVQVYYDSTKISFETLLKVFFDSADPTQVNGQGPDIGRQYRSIIFYTNPREKAIADRYIEKLTQAGKYSKAIAVEVAPFKKFWPAEAYHQNFDKKNPNNSYVQQVSIPRLIRTQKQIPDLIKPGYSMIDK